MRVLGFFTVKFTVVHPTGKIYKNLDLSPQKVAAVDFCEEKGEVVGAPGIEPGTSNLDATPSACLYSWDTGGWRRIRTSDPFLRRRFAPWLRANGGLWWTRTTDLFLIREAL